MTSTVEKLKAKGNVQTNRPHVMDSLQGRTIVLEEPRIYRGTLLTSALRRWLRCSAVFDILFQSHRR